MEYDFDVARAVGIPASDRSGVQVVCLDEAVVQRSSRWAEGLHRLLNEVGARSQRAQGLGRAVTTSRTLGGARVYLLVEGNKVFGLLKVGTKRLFVARGPTDGLSEINPMCVLDFYVVEGHQRSGLGMKLFDTMLKQEAIMPERLAYDKPSPKMLAFLQKHFKLARFHPQNNNFVVFDAYWASSSQSSSRGRGVAQPAPGGAGPQREQANVAVAANTWGPDCRDANLPASRESQRATARRNLPPKGNHTADVALKGGESGADAGLAQQPRGGFVAGPPAPSKATPRSIGDFEACASGRHAGMRSVASACQLFEMPPAGVRSGGPGARYGQGRCRASARTPSPLRQAGGCALHHATTPLVQAMATRTQI